MPARAKRNTVMQHGQPRGVLEEAAEGEISAERVLRATAMTTAKAPRFIAA